MNPLRLGLFARRIPPPVHSAFLVCFILALFLANAAGQTGTPTPPRIDVKGKVVNSITGEPIPRALVTLTGAGFRSMLTDSDGGFSFEGLQRTVFSFQFQKPGYFPPLRPSFVKPESADNVILKLTPAGLIHGQVLDENGEPIEFADVLLLEQRLNNGKREWGNSNSTRVNDDGQYRFANLRPGKYIVAVVPSPTRNFIPAKRGYPRTYFPRAPDRNSATPIQVSAGGQAEANFELSPVPLFTVSGVVAGAKTQGVGLFLDDGYGMGSSLGARADPVTGQFEMRGVPRGNYVLRAKAFQEPGEQLVARTDIRVNADVTGLVVVMHGAIKIPVIIRNDSAQIGTGAPDQGNVQVQAISVTTQQLTGYSSVEGPPENRTTVLRLTDPGKYNISLTPFGNAYVQSARCGSTDLLTEPLVVPASGNLDPIEVVLRNDPAKVSGVIRNAKSPGMIVAFPDRDSNQPPIIFGFGPDGKIYSQPLPPGSYNLYALENPEAIEYGDREALKSYRSKAAHVTLSPNQTTEVTLDPIEVEP